MVKSFKKETSYVVVQSTKALEKMTLRCGDVFFKQRSKSIFVDGLHLNARSSMRMY